MMPRRRGVLSSGFCFAALGVHVSHRTHVSALSTETVLQSQTLKLCLCDRNIIRDKFWGWCVGSEHRRLKLDARAHVCDNNLKRSLDLKQPVCKGPWAGLLLVSISVYRQWGPFQDWDDSQAKQWATALALIIIPSIIEGAVDGETSHQYLLNYKHITKRCQYIFFF